MRNSRIQRFALLITLVVSAMSAGMARADLIAIAIVHSDTDGSVAGLQANLLATGLFNKVDVIDASNPGSTPTLSTLEGYDSVLSYTNFSLDDPAAVGDVFADYVDAGHGLVLATFGLGDVMTVSGGTAFAGRIATSGYSPLVISGDLTDLDGGFLTAFPADPVFNGVDLGALTYYHDSNSANPALDAGATLLATDGTGINLMARSANGRIIGLNIFPGTDPSGNSDDFYKLLGNSLTNVAPIRAVPEPASTILSLQGLAIVGFAMARRRRNRRRSES